MASALCYAGQLLMWRNENVSPRMPSAPRPAASRQARLAGLKSPGAAFRILEGPEP